MENFAKCKPYIPRLLTCRSFGCLLFVVQSHTEKLKGHGAINPLVTWYKDLPALVKANVHAAGFGHFMQILPSFRGKTSVIVGLAERLWDTTNTFHLPLREMKMTPQDFSMITGLKIGG